MKKNIGSIDKIIRLVLAAFFIILFFKVGSGILGYILLAVALIFILTSLFNFCPIWWALKIRTNKNK